MKEAPFLLRPNVGESSYRLVQRAMTEGRKKGMQRLSKLLVKSGR